MRYYTKEWYDLMQRLSYTSGLTMIPDDSCSDEEIQAFYESDLREEIENDRRLYDTPPDYSWAERLLDPDIFVPQNMLFEDGETGELFHPETPEIARQYIEQERRQWEEAFAKRPPFDPAETIECFAECYKKMLRYGALGYPEWVRETVDKRLLALNRMPETAYDRLKKEEEENQRAFDKIMEEASAALEAQDIPEEIRSQLHFHDAHLLALKKTGADAELYLRKDGGWPKETTPYIKIVFRKVFKLEREKGLVLRRKRDDSGEVFSNCQYLYDELYKTEAGYELHMLLCTTNALRYLTVGCENLCFIDNIDFRPAQKDGDTMSFEDTENVLSELVFDLEPSPEAPADAVPFEMMTLDRSERENSKWIELISGYLKTAKTFEIHCWNEETEWIDLALRYGQLKEDTWKYGKIITGEVTTQFVEMLLNMPKPTDTEIDNKMTPFFNVFLDEDFQSCHYGTENFYR